MATGGPKDTALSVYGCDASLADEQPL